MYAPHGFPHVYGSSPPHVAAGLPSPFASPGGVMVALPSPPHHFPYQGGQPYCYWVPTPAAPSQAATTASPHQQSLAPPMQYFVFPTAEGGFVPHPAYAAPLPPMPPSASAEGSRAGATSAQPAHSMPTPPFIGHVSPSPFPAATPHRLLSSASTNNALLRVDVASAQTACAGGGQSLNTAMPTASSSLRSITTNDDVGDVVTLRSSLERLMVDEETSDAVARHAKKLTGQGGDGIPKRDSADSVPGCAEVPGEEDRGMKKKTTSRSAPGAGSASGGARAAATVAPLLRFSSSRQKKGNRPTQVPPPAPGDAELGPRQLIVNYLAPEIDSAGLEQLFAPYGDIEVARIVTDTTTGLSRGYGFVYYRHHVDANTAIDEASGRVLLGRRIRVSYAIPQRAVSAMHDTATDK